MSLQVPKTGVCNRCVVTGVRSLSAVCGAVSSTTTPPFALIVHKPLRESDRNLFSHTLTQIRTKAIDFDALARDVSFPRRAGFA